MPQLQERDKEKVLRPRRKQKKEIIQIIKKAKKTSRQHLSRRNLLPNQERSLSN